MGTSVMVKYGHFRVRFTRLVAVEHILSKIWNGGRHIRYAGGKFVYLGYPKGDLLADIL